MIIYTRVITKFVALHSWRSTTSRLVLSKPTLMVMAISNATKDEKNENEVIVNDHDEIVYSFHITNLHTNCTVKQLHDSSQVKNASLFAEK